LASGRNRHYRDTGAAVRRRCAGHWVSFALIVAIGGFALWYGVAAIRTLADPQPGSSMSAAPGTSFTL